jgi:hypothetical protein
MAIKNFIQEHSQGVAETLKLSPPVLVTGTNAAGVDLQTWIIVGTLIYTILLVVHKIIQIAKDVRRFKSSNPDTTLNGDL